MNAVIPRYFIDVHDIAIAAALWKLNRWMQPGRRQYSRQTASGVVVCEVSAGAEAARDFLNEFVFDATECGLLADLPALSWVGRDFWTFLVGQRFSGQFWSKHDGATLMNDELYASLDGSIGEIYLFQYGVQSIFDFCISMVTEAASLKALIPTKARLLDATSARMFGYGWSLWVTRGVAIAGWSPPDPFARTIVMGDEVTKDQLEILRRLGLGDAGSKSDEKG